MGRAPCCEKVGLKRGRWTAEEDEILTKYILENGEGSWRSLPKNAGLLRCGKSCRLRWINYLRADLKRGNISSAEEDIIINLHASVGNKWSLIASQLPGRTDNEIKNYWNSHLSRRIDTFRRSNKDSLPMIINLKKKGKDLGTKRKGGRTSRAAMKKSKAPHTNKDNINSNREVNSFPQQETKMTSSSTISWNEEELESLVLDSWVVNSPCLEDNIEKSYSAMVGSEEERGCMVFNNLNEDVIICSKNSLPLGPGAAEDQANSSRHEILGPQAEEEKMQGSYGVLSSDGVMGTINNQTQSPSRVWPCNINEESESGVTTSFTKAGSTNEDPETGSSSNCGGAVSSENWYYNSSTTSYFDEEILEWGWQKVIHGVQELHQNEDQDEMISSLWENDDHYHELGLVDHATQNFDALGSEIMDIEKQKTAALAWLFS